MRLLDFAQSQGVTMGSRHGSRIVGFTTNEQAADRLSVAGATVLGCYNATGPRGWEVSFLDGADAASVEDSSPTTGSEA